MTPDDVTLGELTRTVQRFDRDVRDLQDRMREGEHDRRDLAIASSRQDRTLEDLRADVERIAENQTWTTRATITIALGVIVSIILPIVTGR